MGSSQAEESAATNGKACARRREAKRRTCVKLVGAAADNVNFTRHLV